MNIGVLGTGTVGSTIASKLVSLGHDVTMGARSATNEKAAGWARQAGSHASHGDFARAAAAGEIVFNCTAGVGALEALKAAGGENLKGKLLIDVSNPLDFSKGMPPSLQFSGEDSLAERIQRAFPDAKVVKTLNTITAGLMVNPGKVHGDHDVFLSGNDADAKARVETILREWFGWKNVVDLGDITTARGAEAYVLLWLRLWGALKTADFNIRIIR
jgi:8-hydroxy-5-deazaflavin:NADPH oxidoreductase